MTWAVRKSIYGWVIDPIDVHVDSGTRRTDAEAHALAQQICDEHRASGELAEARTLLAAQDRAAKRLADRLGGAELDELRGYKERTEAALVELCCDYAGDLGRLHSAEAHKVFQADIATLKARGLWRDPQPGEVKP